MSSEFPTELTRLIKLLEGRYSTEPRDGGRSKRPDRLITVDGIWGSGIGKGEEYVRVSSDIPGKGFRTIAEIYQSPKGGWNLRRTATGMNEMWETDDDIVARVGKLLGLTEPKRTLPEEQELEMDLYEDEAERLTSDKRDH